MIMLWLSSRDWYREEIARHEFESLNAQTFKQSMKVNSRRNSLTQIDTKATCRRWTAWSPTFQQWYMEKSSRRFGSARSNPFQGATRDGACVPFHCTRSGIVEIEKALKEKRPLPTLITNWLSEWIKNERALFFIQLFLPSFQLNKNCRFQFRKTFMV